MMKELMEKDVAPNPIQQFEIWWQEALNSGIEEVNAMTLATVDKDNRPSARIVLLKGFDENGFVFFTNYHSQKAKDMEGNKHVSLVFFWKELERQVRISGIVKKISDKDSEQYFKSRPLISRLGAWASDQSAIIESREVLENKFRQLEEKYSDGNVPRPLHWGGYSVEPEMMEFWQGRSGRLHDRIEYSKQLNSEWLIYRRSP